MENQLKFANELRHSDMCLQTSAMKKQNVNRGHKNAIHKFTTQ